VAKKVYYGPVYFRRGIVPFITISVAGRRQDAGVTVAEVDLNGLWNEVKKIKADEVSVPYLSYWIDASGLLIAHSDNKLIESKSNMSQLPQVRRALAGASGDSSARIQEGTDIQGQAVFSAFAPVRKLNWFVFFEMLSKEVYAPARDSIMRSGLLLVFGIVVVLLTTVWLSRRKSPSRSDIHN